MSDTNHQDSQTGSAIDGLNRLSEDSLLRFIESVTATLEEALPRRRALESADTPPEGTAPEPELPASPQQDAGGTDAIWPAS